MAASAWQDRPMDIDVAGGRRVVANWWRGMIGRCEWDESVRESFRTDGFTLGNRASGMELRRAIEWET